MSFLSIAVKTVGQDQGFAGEKYLQPQPFTSQFSALNSSSTHHGAINFDHPLR